MANSGASEATTYSNLVFCAVIPLVVNCALTCTNHVCGSAGQNGESFICTAETLPVASGAGGSSLDISLLRRCSCQGHQCCVVYMNNQ